MARPHADAIHRARCDAEFAAGAFTFDDGVHEVLGAHDRIDRANVTAMNATDTERFIDHGNGRVRGFRERQRVSAQQVRESLHGRLATRRTQIDRDGVIDDGRCIGPTAGVSALCALRLRQQFIDLLDEIVACSGQATRRQAEKQSGYQCDERNCKYGNQREQPTFRLRSGHA